MKSIPLLSLLLLASPRPRPHASAFAPPRPSVARSSSAASSSALRALPEGMSKSTLVPGSGRPVRAGDVVSVRYRCSASGSDSAFARSDGQRVIAGDGTMIRGWDAAIRTMREGERSSFVVSDPAFGYGPDGVPPFVPPNAGIDIDLEVLAVEDAVGMAGEGGSSALDAMGMDGPASRPRTPGAIAAAYEAKMREKARDAPEEKEGIAWLVDKIRTSYFFGLFEGETGQEAPWYLKPSITFPIAFLVVGIAFWASIVGGAISERGMPTTDELDEIIVSGDYARLAIAYAATLIQV